MIQEAFGQVKESRLFDSYCLNFPDEWRKPIFCAVHEQMLVTLAR